MSHDQRPGKIRVVKDSARAPGISRTNPAGGVAANAAGASGRVGATGTAGGANLTAANAGATAAGAALPLLPAALFLLACLIGGVVVVLLRPF